MLIWGNQNFCSITSDTQITMQDTLEASNGLPKVVKVSDNVIVALSGNVEGSVKIFDWEYCVLPAKKRDFKRSFNSKFSYTYADDCFKILCDFGSKHIYSPVNIYVAGKNSTGGMFYGIFYSGSKEIVSEINRDHIVKLGSLPFDLGDRKEEFNYDKFMSEFDNVKPDAKSIPFISSLIKNKQAKFIDLVASNSKHSNNDCCNEIIVL